MNLDPETWVKLIGALAAAVATVLKVVDVRRKRRAARHRGNGATGDGQGQVVDVGAHVHRGQRRGASGERRGRGGRT